MLTNEASPPRGRRLLILAAVGYAVTVGWGSVQVLMARGPDDDWVALLAGSLLLLLPAAAMCRGNRFGYYFVTAIVVYCALKLFLAAAITLLLVITTRLAPGNVNVDMRGFESWSLEGMALMNLLMLSCYAVLAYVLLHKEARAWIRKKRLKHVADETT